MAWIKMIPENEAEGELAELYRNINRKIQVRWIIF
jgi:hypothetical protein